MPETVDDQSGASAPKTRKSAAGVGWFLLILGVVVAAAAGVVLTRAWLAKDTITGWIGALLLLGGALVAISGGMRTKRAFGLLTDPPESEAPGPASGLYRTPDALPRLGELLVYKYHLITEKDLQRALARQKEFAGRPLGEILVEMGNISWRDLAKTLEDQLSYGDPWKRKRTPRPRGPQPGGERES